MEVHALLKGEIDQRLPFQTRRGLHLSIDIRICRWTHLLDESTHSEAARYNRCYSLTSLERMARCSIHHLLERCLGLVRVGVKNMCQPVVGLDISP
jgi:hypothetical protein